MPDYWKYIATYDDVMIIFPPTVEHKAIADAVGSRVTSAGLIRVYDDGQIRCFGESTTLGLHSDPKRDERLARGLADSD